MAAFLDGSVLIRGIERPDSESGRLVDLAVGGRMQGVVDELVLHEVEDFFRAHRGPEFARRFGELLRERVLVISHQEAAAYEGGAPAALPPRVRHHRAAARAGGATHYFVDRAGGAPYPDERAPTAFSRRDLIRCLLISLVVGTALVLINVRPTVDASGAPAGVDMFRVFLNYLVPFSVASFSAYTANRARMGPPARGT